MKRIAFTTLFLIIHFSILAEDIEIDALTGYNNHLIKNYEKYYSQRSSFNSILDLSPITNNDIMIFSDLEKLLTKKQGKDYNYRELFEIFKKAINGNYLKLYLGNSENITEICTFIPNELSKNGSSYIVISKYFLSKYDKNRSLILSSFFRSIKEYCDYEKRSKNNEYTSWDIVENYMYLLDSYYFQVHFLKEYFPFSNSKLSKYESYLITNYDKETLSSFSIYFLGIDRQLIINGYSLLLDLSTNEIDITSLLDNFYEMRQEWVDFEKNITGNEIKYTDLVSYYSFSAFYIFYLNNRFLLSQINNKNKESYQKLLLDIDEINKKYQNNVEYFYSTRDKYQFEKSYYN